MVSWRSWLNGGLKRRRQMRPELRPALRVLVLLRVLVRQAPSELRPLGLRALTLLQAALQVLVALRAA